MNRLQLEDVILDTKKALKFYEAIATNCTTCVSHNGGRCEKFHSHHIPADFIQQGCGDWDFNDVPF